MKLIEKIKEHVASCQGVCHESCCPCPGAVIISACEIRGQEIPKTFGKGFPKEKWQAARRLSDSLNL